MMPVRGELNNGTKVCSERFDFWWVCGAKRVGGSRNFEIPTLAPPKVQHRLNSVNAAQEWGAHVVVL